MPISFSCPHCGHTTQAADQYAGHTGPCAACGNQVTIPQPGEAPAKRVNRPAPRAAAPKKKSSSGGSKGPMIAIVLVVVVGVMFVCGGVLLALLLPAVQAAREAARRMECSNNLKQIGLAMHNYHDTYKSFPPAYFADSDGQPIQSWRTLILPFIDSSPLREQIDITEAWNSPQNEAATATAMAVYSCPSDTSAPTETNYLVITGPGTMFATTKGPRFADIVDGTSNTILAVDARGPGIRWAEPKDLNIETFVAMFGPNGTGSSSGNASHVGGLNALFADGSVKFLPYSLDQQTARALATSAGGENIGAF